MTALRISFVISSSQHCCTSSQIWTHRNLEMQLFHPHCHPFHGMPVGRLMQLGKMFVALTLGYLFYLMMKLPSEGTSMIISFPLMAWRLHLLGWESFSLLTQWLITKHSSMHYLSALPAKTFFCGHGCIIRVKPSSKCNKIIDITEKKLGLVSSVLSEGRGKSEMSWDWKADMEHYAQLMQCKTVA